MKRIYKPTGEYRPPKEGEWYLDKGNEPRKADAYIARFCFILSPRQIEEVDDEKE